MPMVRASATVPDRSPPGETKSTRTVRPPPSEANRAKTERFIERVAQVDLGRILNLPGTALLNEYQTAAVLNVSVRVLRDWRVKNIGPKYLKINNRVVRYKLADTFSYRDAQPTGGEGSTPRSRVKATP
jgi:hypothetical protein